LKITNAVCRPLKLSFPGLLLLFIAANVFTVHAQQTAPAVSSVKADTWVATDSLGRKVVIDARGGHIRKDRFVGIFYFVWHGALGYDRQLPPRADEGIQPKLPSDTVSPYDNTKLLAANPDNPKWGPVSAMHYWGEPWFGYYLTDDEWVIRKHAQLLSDAGVDVILLDATNAIFSSI
jgi:hypothetical protein